jgi:hypothetical protein
LDQSLGADHFGQRVASGAVGKAVRWGRVDGRDPGGEIALGQELADRLGSLGRGMARPVGDRAPATARRSEISLLMVCSPVIVRCSCLSTAATPTFLGNGLQFTVKRLKMLEKSRKLKEQSRSS